MSDPLAPEDCETMAQLRAAIDAVDTSLVAQLAKRAAYIRRAAVLKKRDGLPARIDARIEEVVAHVRDQAGLQGLDPDLAEKIWRQLVEWSIRQEEQELGR